MFKWLRRVIHDLSSGKLKVRSIYRAKDIERYVGGFADPDLPDVKKVLTEPIAVEPVGKAPSPPPPKEERRRKPKRWSLKEAKIHPRHPRLQDIMEELAGISFDKANIHAVVLRVFLELSTDDFLRRHRVEVLPDKGKHVTLKARLLAAINVTETKKWLDRKQASATRQLAGSSKLHSAGTLSDYVHNQDLHPSSSDVIAIWKSLAVYLAAVHDH
jgi:hypothetical protein